MKRKGRSKLEDGASVAEHARRLRGRPGWDPAGVLAGRDDALQQQLDSLRSTQALDAAEACDDCLRERVKGSDSSALCPAHLARALGL
ncbi:MAG: hypothetical protein ABIJ09_24835 [Pseudomonadota bacterium]